MAEENQGSTETDGQKQENSEASETTNENESQQSGAGDEAKGEQKEQTKEEILDALLTESAKETKPTQSGHNFDKGLSKMQERMSVLTKQIEALTSASLSANKPVDADPFSGLNDDDVIDVGGMRKTMKAFQNQQQKQTEALMARVEKMQEDTANQIRSSAPKQHQVSDSEILSSIEKTYKVSLKEAEVIAVRAARNLKIFETKNPGMNETSQGEIGRQLVDLEAQRLALELKQGAKQSESDSDDSGNVESTTVTKKGAKTITKTKPTAHKTARTMAEAKDRLYKQASG